MSTTILCQKSRRLLGPIAVDNYLHSEGLQIGVQTQMRFLGIINDPLSILVPPSSGGAVHSWNQGVPVIKLTLVQQTVSVFIPTPHLLVIFSRLKQGSEPGPPFLVRPPTSIHLVFRGSVPRETDILCDSEPLEANNVSGARTVTRASLRHVPATSRLDMVSDGRRYHPDMVKHVPSVFWKCVYGYPLIL